MFDWKSITELNTEKSNNVDSAVLLLDEYSLISIEGPDAVKFLQGQVTCDIDQVEKGTFKYGAHCNHKGRMNSSFFVAKTGSESLGLRVHKSIAEFAFSSLKKYIVFSKADISLRNDIAIIGVVEEAKINSLLKAINLTLPELGHSLNQSGITLLHHKDSRIELWMTKDKIKEICPALQSTGARIGNNEWQANNIISGIGEIQQPLEETLLPQELNMHLNGGISFDKGCYTGQEVVARIHYKGAQKKHMYRCHLDYSANDNIELSPGDAIFHEGKKCGQIISVAPSVNSALNSSLDILVLCNDNLYGKENIHLEKNTSANLTWLTLPYAIT